jgi:hypothetical protein
LFEHLDWVGVCLNVQMKTMTEEEGAWQQEGYEENKTPGVPADFWGLVKEAKEVCVMDEAKDYNCAVLSLLAKHEHSLMDAEAMYVCC